MSFLRDGYRNVWLLGFLLILGGISLLFGAHYEAATVYPADAITWGLGIISLFVFSAYFLAHVRWISEVVGHPVSGEREEVLIRYAKVFLFFLLMVLFSFFLAKAGYGWLSLILWVLLFLYPVAVAVDDVGELDNIRSSVEAWVRSPGVLVELFVVFPVLLLTAFALEVTLGTIGAVLSLLMTIFFTVPLLTTMAAFAYLLRYPLTKRALEL